MKKVLVPFVAIGLLTMALCVGALLLVMRSRAGEEGAPDASAGAADAPAVRAVVTLPEGQPRGVLRVTPAFTAPVAGFVAAGAVVEMTKTLTKDSQTWYRVKTMTAPPLTGWMHSGILKTQ